MSARDRSGYITRNDVIDFCLGCDSPKLTGIVRQAARKAGAHDLDEIVSVVLGKLWKARELAASLNPGAVVRWLQRVCQTTVADEWRALLRQPVQAGEGLMNFVAAREDVEQQVRTHAILGRVNRSLRGEDGLLNSMERECLALLAQGSTPREIAERAGVAGSTVRAAISRGRAKLRAMLDTEGLCAKNERILFDRLVPDFEPTSGVRIARGYSSSDNLHEDFSTQQWRESADRLFGE